MSGITIEFHITHIISLLPDTDVLVLVSQLNSTRVVVGVDTVCSAAVEVLRTTLGCKVVVIAAVLSYLVEMHVIFNYLVCIGG